MRPRQPSDLPIEQAQEIKLAINMMTARAIGLSITPDLVGRADEIIE